MQHIHHISQAKGMDILRLDLCKDGHMKMIHLKSSFSEKKNVAYLKASIA